MGLELLAAIVAAVGVAGFAMILRKITGKLLPKWIVPASAGLGLIGFSIWNEYNWFPRVSGELPEGVEVVWQDVEPQLLRPWTYVAPLTVRFLALDTRSLARHPGNDALVMVEMYAFARWRGVEPGLVVVDCANDRSVRLTAEMKIDDAGVLSGGEWVPLAADDATGKRACGGASDG